MNAMKRDVNAALIAWKNSPRRKPLLLRGARQSGKTHLLRSFAADHFRRVAYLDFEQHPELDSIFTRDLDPRRILTEIEVHVGFALQPGDDLLILDEIQRSDRALNSLKYFCEQAPEYAVAAAGSLLGVKVASPGSFPVGKVRFLDLHPLTFLEFLDAVGDERYRTLLTDSEGLQPLSEPHHRHLLDRLSAYLVIGGMPEAVRHHAEGGAVEETRVIQKDILDAYILDFAKHAPATDLPKLTALWESVPRQLAKENKKFIYSLVKRGARARGYEDALRWLEGAGLVARALAIERVAPPLAHFADPSCFKIYAVDVGLLGATARVPPASTLRGQRLFTEYEGAFIENYVAQQIRAVVQPDLYYWRSRGGRAEVDFLLEDGDSIAPLEVKAGLNPHSKSLRSFDEQFAPGRLWRSNLLNLKKDGKTCNVPLYAIGLLPRFLAAERGPDAGSN